MVKSVFRILKLASAILLFSGIAWGQDDVEGSKDHPLFNRLPGTYILQYEAVEFDSYTFLDERKREIKVEGRLYKFRYGLKEGAARMSALQIIRNYENAVKKIGGTVMLSNFEENSYMKIINNGKEIWMHVFNNVGEPILIIIEKEAMTQHILANAEAMGNDLKSSGHVAIYGVFFDTNKSEVKPDSKPALEEIAKVLKKEPGLRLKVVGHTDMTGALEANMKLSQARGEAVVQALVSQHGIAASRLKGHGVGPLAPIASNDTEEGRAKNRRVELVKE